MGKQIKDLNADNNISMEQLIKKFLPPYDLEDVMQSYTKEHKIRLHNSGHSLSDIILVSKDNAEKIDDDSFKKIFGECFDEDKNE